MSLIERLTPEQEALIPVYREKWRQIALSTKRIDRQQATEAVKAAYTEIHKPQPEILFFNSPDAARKNLTPSLLESQLRNQTGKQLWHLVTQLHDQLQSQLGKQVKKYLQIHLHHQLHNQLGRQLRNQLWNQLQSQETTLLYNCIQPEGWAIDGSWFDFCVSVLNCAHEPTEWKAFQLLVINCGWIFHFDKLCLVCDHPIQLSFDNQQRLHAEGKPAIQFADGYNLYFYHGTRR